MRTLLLLLFSFLAITAQAQSTVKGILHNSNAEPAPFAMVGLFNASDSSLVKAETTNEAGAFQFSNMEAGTYYLKASFLGAPDLYVDDIKTSGSGEHDLGTLALESQSEELEGFTVEAERTMVEVHPDKTIFNVQGTINSTGTDAISLLRKAPGVTVDNQDNVTVLGRAGVIVYIDGKPLPLGGDDLSNYLKSLPADQIDRIEIITAPGAKYEAEGNAGIIDIRLKKDKNLGANGSLSGTLTRGQLTRYNINGSGNYRNKKMNVFGLLGYNVSDNFHNMEFDSYQNGLFMDEINDQLNERESYNYRFGTDFFLKKNHTLGFLIGGSEMDWRETSFNQISISNQDDITNIDSVLVADNDGNHDRGQNAFNLNYRFLNESGQSLNIDLDYARFQNTSTRFQPNLYYNNVEQDSLMTSIINNFNTPNDITIYTSKVDYERNVKGGKLGFGGKFSQVETDNTFEVFDVLETGNVLDSSRSNIFTYDETVYAGYLSYATSLGEKVKLIAGLRAEQTISVGTLTAFLPSLTEPPVEQNYLNLFPSAGITWQAKPMQSYSLNYGRRINRPDYNVLNPFRNQLSEISIEKGNPFLQPEIVNNVELGYTWRYKYNFKVGYSKTTNQITRLIGPDDVDPRAGFISWDNLASQTTLSFSASLPITVTKWWDAYINLSSSHIDNQADYGDGAVVDVQVFTYTVFQSSTFKLPNGFKGEISGYYSGPGVWGGVFKYDANYSLDLGLQKTFFKDRLKARLSASNITNRFGWRGESVFNGLRSWGTGSWDNRTINLSLNYNFGNQNIKSRKRKTGIEEESGRVQR